MDPVWLPNFWAGVIAFAILAYVILDGYDLGVGILFGTTTNEQQRVTMMQAIAPYWDGNETWLVLVGAGLFAAFPMVYAIFLPAFYLPVALMLLGLIFRGVAFEFRHRSTHMRPVWDLGFFLGSLIAAFVQGVAIGTMVQELTVVDGRYAGGPFEWVTPFSILCGVGLVLGYALLGAAWLVMKTEGDLRDWAYRRLDWLLPGVLWCLLRCLRSRSPSICACSIAGATIRGSCCYLCSAPLPWSACGLERVGGAMACRSRWRCCWSPAHSRRWAPASGLT